MMGLQSQTFSTPGAISFTVPAGVGLVWVNMIGGTCGNMGGLNGGGMGGAGSAESCFHVPVPVTPGGTVSGVVGAGGASGTWIGYPFPPTSAWMPTVGGDTSFDVYKVKGSSPSGDNRSGGGSPLSSLFGNGSGQRGYLGGGWLGGDGGAANSTNADPTNNQGFTGSVTNVHHFGGSGGGGTEAIGSTSFYGGPSGGVFPGSAVVAGATRGGGGGGASVWGTGASGTTHDTPATAPSNPGTGAGGGGGFNSGSGNGTGANGTGGRIEVFWIE